MRSHLQLLAQRLSKVRRCLLGLRMCAFSRGESWIPCSHVHQTGMMVLWQSTRQRLLLLNLSINMNVCVLQAVTMIGVPPRPSHEQARQAAIQLAADKMDHLHGLALARKVSSCTFGLLFVRSSCGH